MSSDRQKARKATEAETPAPSDALIGPLFSAWPDIGVIVLKHMDPLDRSLFAGVSPSISDAVMKSENPSDMSKPLPVAGVTPGIWLDAFTDSLEKFRYGVLTYPSLLSADKSQSTKRGLVCSIAASKGNLDVLREARAIGCPWGNTATYACRNGHLQILQWARLPYQLDYRFDPVQLTSDCYYSAAKGGHLDVIKFLREERCDFDNTSAFEAARLGHPRCLELLYAICTEIDGRWRPSGVCASAVSSGRIDVLKVAWNLQPVVYNAEYYNDPFMNFNVEPMQWAADGGRIDMMEWLLNNGCPWGSHTCQTIMDVGNPAVSKWAAEALSGCRCDSPFGTKMSSTCSVHGDPLI